MTTIAESLARLCPRPLSVEEMTLLALLVDAHITAAAANINNASNQQAAMYGRLGCPLASGLIASLMAMGGSHAPAQQAREWLFKRLGDDPEQWQGIADADAASGLRIPGYGNGFHKHDIDPALEETAAYLDEQWPHVSERIKTGFRALAVKPGLFPNLAAYTGAVAEIIDLPHGLESMIVFMPRLPVWAMCWLSPSPQ